MRMFAATIACLLTLPGCAAPQPQPQPPGNADSPEVIALINQRRDEAGCPPVNSEQRLAAAAHRQAVDMKDRGVQEHTGSDGSSPQQRIESAGFTPAASTGEIMLWGNGSTSPQKMVDAWMGSPPHREVIEQCSFTHAGTAVLKAEDRYFAVVAFARPG